MDQCGKAQRDSFFQTIWTRVPDCLWTKILRDFIFITCDSLECWWHFRGQLEKNTQVLVSVLEGLSTRFQSVNFLSSHYFTFQKNNVHSLN